MADTLLRKSIKNFFNGLSILLLSPLALSCYLEKRLSPGEEVFLFCAHLAAILPGLPGVYLRRALYYMTLDHCSLDSYIGFGVIFTHRGAQVETKAYIGPYSLIGCACLRSACLIGSRTSILSGASLHEQDEDGCWLPYDSSKLKTVEVGSNAWIGEGAIIMADIGKGSMVAAGAVVSSPVPDKITVAGNPARLVKSFEQASSYKKQS
jgi:virginiamycin A acetyltransferase